MSRLAPLLPLCLLLAPACGGSSSPESTTTASGAGPAAGDTPSAEQVLDRYVEAIGGAEAHRSVTSLRMTGTFAIPKMGVSGTLEIAQAAPNNLYMHVEFPGMGAHEAGTSDGVAWEKSAMTGSRIIEGEERDRTLLDATLNADVDWRSHYEAEYAGKDEVDGRAAHKVKLTPKVGGNPRTRTYDAETGLLVRTEEVQKTQMGEIQAVSVHGDYREVAAPAGPIKISHRTQVTAMGNEQVITVEKLEVNPTLPADRFAIPAEIKALQTK